MPSIRHGRHGSGKFDSRCLQISRLYRPLDTEAISSDDEEDEGDVGGTQLLPLHYQPRAPRTPSKGARPGPTKPTRLSDVWDEREELFDIGEESDDEESRTGGAPPPPPPKIVVTPGE